MKPIKYILLALGFIVYLLSCCLMTADDEKWYVLMLISIFGAALMGLAVLIDYRQQKKQQSDKPVVRVMTTDYAGEFEKLNNQIIIEEIMRG